MRESTVEAILVKGIKKLGGRAYKWVSPGNDGVPDRIVIVPDTSPIFVELKTDTGKTSPRQDMQLAFLESCGQAVTVLHGKSEVEAFLAMLEYDLKERKVCNSKHTITKRELLSL